MFYYCFIINFYIILDIGCANVSQSNPLEAGGFLIIFSDEKLCIRKILAMYENIGGKHSYISRNINNIDILSYISLTLFIDVYSRSLFTNDCRAGRKLFAHITPKEVVYYLGKDDSITFQSNSMLTLTGQSLQIYEILNNSNTREQLISIFHSQNNSN